MTWTFKGMARLIEYMSIKFLITMLLVVSRDFF